MQVSALESKEVEGFFWFQTEINDLLDEPELESLIQYFLVVYNAWETYFKAKHRKAPMFRISLQDGEMGRIRIQMLHVVNMIEEVLAEKIVTMDGRSFKLLK